MRLVLDTNVVVSALLWGGEPRLLLQAGREKRVELFTSTALLAELSEVLERPKFAMKIAAAALSVDQIVDRYAVLASLVQPAPTPRVAPDPDDDVVIGTALAAQANHVVSGDQSLLSVATYQAIRIIRVSEAIQLMSGSGNPV